MFEFYIFCKVVRLLEKLNYTRTHDECMKVKVFKVSMREPPHWLQ